MEQMNWLKNLFSSKTTELVTEDELQEQYNAGFNEGFLAGCEQTLIVANRAIDEFIENNQ
jgi:hypothetical protein